MVNRGRPKCTECMLQVRIGPGEGWKAFWTRGEWAWNMGEGWPLHGLLFFDRIQPFPQIPCSLANGRGDVIYRGESRAGSWVEVIVILPSRFVRQSRECKETTKHKHKHGQRHRHRHRHRHEMAAHEEDLLEPTVVGVDSRTAGRWLASAASVAMASHLTRVVLAYLTSLEDNSDREDAASTQLMGLQSCRRDLPM